MTIEEHIKQARFGNEHEKAVVNILFTASWLHAENLRRLKPFGVTPEQFNVLRILRGSYPRAMMLSDIASRMIDRNSNATRLVEKLRRKGLVKRQVCQRDRRQVDIFITARGLALLKKTDADAAEWFNAFRSVTKNEAAELNRLLDKLRTK